MNPITLLFFATIREKIGQKSLALEVPDSFSVADLKALLCQDYPALKETIQRTLVAVNQNFASDEEPIPPHAEVALFPPVSGGSEPPTLIEIVTAPLDLNDILSQITSDATGAACLFTGMVRGQTPGGEMPETLSLEYEAYIPMARQKMQQIAGEIRARWPSVYGIALIQRIGRLEPRMPSVIVACSASHRGTGAFEAARYGIDRLKEIVPIWKKEISPTGEMWVEGSYLPTKED